MSHVVTVDVRVRNLKALAAACERLGLELLRDKKTFRWFGKWVNDYHDANAAVNNGINPKDFGKCEHAIAVKGNKKKKPTRLGWYPTRMAATACCGISTGRKVRQFRTKSEPTQVC